MISDLWDKSTIDYRMLPLYSVNGSQLMTYVLVGITAVTLGYVTIQEEAFDTPPPPPTEEPKMGGKKHKSKTYKKHKK
jgi:hypothetical protein